MLPKNACKTGWVLNIDLTQTDKPHTEFFLNTRLNKSTKETLDAHNRYKQLKAKEDEILNTVLAQTDKDETR